MRESSIRLAFSIAVSLAAAFFGHFYSVVSEMAILDARIGRLPMLCQFLSNYALLALLVPAVLLGAGINFLRRKDAVALEILSNFGWLWAAGWTMLQLVAWKLPYVPIFSGMKWQ